ncbi:hypothetical protein ACEQ8H_001634 [Pleosporales sp. CAS-2024a]
MNFIFRITYIDESGVCIIGMQKIAMLPLIIFEVIVNVYLTLLFVIPLRGMYSYQNHSHSMLKRMAFRSFVGSCATLTTSVINLTILMLLHGEPGWICLMCCNADILFCVIVLHWVSSKEQKQEDSQARSISAGGSKPHINTIGSHNSRKKRRVSLTEVEIELALELDKEMADSQLQRPLAVTTECKATTKGGQTGKLSRYRGEANEDEVELRSIYMKTIQKRQVEVVVPEADMERRASQSAGRESWSRRSVGFERMV